jgi:hypothetical protein
MPRLLSELFRPDTSGTSAVNSDDLRVEAPGGPGRRRFVDHHASLGRVVSLLAAQARSEPSIGLAEACSELSRRLLGHFAAEEEFLLPKFREANARDAASLDAEHHSIRDLLAGIEIDAARGTLRPESLEQLLKALASHASHEKATFYPWAQDRYLAWVWARAARLLSVQGLAAQPPAL